MVAGCAMTPAMTFRLLRFFGPATVAVATLSASACGPLPESKKPTPKPVASVQTKKPLRVQLGEALRTVKSRGPILAALNADVKADLQAILAQLPANERKALLEPGGELAQKRPLLHTLAGGDDPVALFSLATQAFASEMMYVARGQGKNKKKGTGDLVGVVAELARRSASQWLREQAVLVNSDRALTPAQLLAIVKAADVVGRHDITRLVHQVVADIDPNPLRKAQLAKAYAEELDEANAVAALSSVGDAKPANAAERIEWDAARRAVEAVKLVKAPASGRDSVLTKARAYLDLKRYEEASDTLKATSPASDLALATATARARLKGTACPGVPGGAGNVLICASAWKKDSTAKAMRALLNKAWATGKGRDSRALETHLALGHVVPWVYGLVTERMTQSAFTKRLKAFKAAVKEAAKVEPTLTGLELFVDAHWAGAQAGLDRRSGARGIPSKAVQDQLIARAKKLAAERPQDRFVQSGVLGVAALFSHERDVFELIEMLPDELHHENTLSRATLRMWTAIARKRTATAEKARAEFQRALPNDERAAQLVLYMAEADAALADDKKNYEVLQKVAKQLQRPGTPIFLRLQAVLDMAGSRARRGERYEAIDVLNKIVPSLPKRLPIGADMATLAKSYLLILRARAAAGPERIEYRNKLALHIMESVKAGVELPPSAQFWQELWVLDLDYRIKLKQCRKVARCAAREKKRLADALATVRDRLGKETSTLFFHGALPAGVMQLSFNVASNIELMPAVHFQPRLLVLEMPGRGVEPSKVAPPLPTPPPKK